MVRHNCHGISISTHLSLVLSFKKELRTSNVCVEMDIPWQLCRTIGPLLSQRFLSTSAKAQSGGYPWSETNKQNLTLTVFSTSEQAQRSNWQDYTQGNGNRCPLAPGGRGGTPSIFVRRCMGQKILTTPCLREL